MDEIKCHILFLFTFKNVMLSWLGSEIILNDITGFTELGYNLNSNISSGKYIALQSHDFH